MRFKRIVEDDQKTADNFDDDEMKQLLSNYSNIKEVADPFSLMSASDSLEMNSNSKNEKSKSERIPKVG